jgi:flagellar hook protein FlgE
MFGNPRFEVSMFANALSGLNVATKSIGAISHNIANAASAGFKASTARFSDVMASASPDLVPKGAVGSGARLAASTVDFTQGNLKTTGQALDLAITGQGMFVKFAGADEVDFDAPGAGDLFFTRNGSFSLDRNNYLVDSAGRFVASAAGQKVQIPSGLETEFETDLYVPPPAAAAAGPLKVYRDAVAGAESPEAQEAALIAAGLAAADFKRDSSLPVSGSTREVRGRLVLTDAAAERLGLEDGASRVLDPDRFSRFDIVSAGTATDLYEAERARIHDELGLGGLELDLETWEPARAAHAEFLRASGPEIDTLNTALGNAGIADRIARLKANLAVLPDTDLRHPRVTELVAQADALAPGKLEYDTTKALLEAAREDYEDQIAEIDTDALAAGWNLAGHKVALRLDGALGSRLSLDKAAEPATEEGAISFAGGRIWKGFGTVAAEIGRVVKEQQVLGGSLIEVALGFIAPAADTDAPTPPEGQEPEPLDPRITVDDVNKILDLGRISVSRLKAETFAPRDLTLRADILLPAGGTLASLATKPGFDETVEAPPRRDLLSAIEVTTDGRVFATYGGGSGTASPEPVGQLAVAFFPNPALLTQVGGSDFRRSPASGPPEVRALGEAAGTQIRAGVLEMANVDLTEELVQMLKYQQMFQSASKAMQTDVDSVAKVIEVR